MDEATKKYNRRYYLADRARLLADGGGRRAARNSASPTFKTKYGEAIPRSKGRIECSE